MTINNHLPIIDWYKETDKNAYLIELLDMFIKNLNEDFRQIQTMFIENNIAALHSKVHKLHGAVCYLRTPRLKQVIELFESNMKKNKKNELGPLLDQLETEIRLLIETYQK